MGFVKNICLICAWFSAAGGGEGTNWLTEIPWPVYSNRRLRWEAAEEEPILKIFILAVEWLFCEIDLSSACKIQLLKERVWGLLRWRLCLFCSAHTLCICPFCFPAARLLWRVRILWQNTGLTELLVKSFLSWAACLEHFRAGGFWCSQVGVSSALPDLKYAPVPQRKRDPGAALSQGSCKFSRLFLKTCDKALNLYYKYNDKVFKWCYSESQKK